MDKKTNQINSEVFCNDFQEQVSHSLVRHKSILDIMTKMDEYNARINRAVAKSVTTCGCISIHAEKQNFEGEEFEDLANHVDSHVHGSLCDNCGDVLSEEMGNYLFYLTSLCNTLGLNLHEVISKEYERNKLLGIYSLK
ncbi:MAG TPA: DUF1573 domain-containing protein [Tissierellaceae bacterium]|nr:DUF1573 domain-containing protein [Tissierellaceae bacterium]